MSATNRYSVSRGLSPAQHSSDSGHSDPAQGHGVLLVIERTTDHSKDVVSLAEYQGFPFVNIRNWFEKNGRWFPSTKRGFSIRRGDVQAFINALQTGLARLDGGSQ